MSPGRTERKPLNSLDIWRAFTAWSNMQMLTVFGLLLRRGLVSIALGLPAWSVKNGAFSPQGTSLLSPPDLLLLDGTKQPSLTPSLSVLLV